MKTKKMLAMLLGLTMIFSLFPSMGVLAAEPVTAAYATGSVAYLDEAGEEKTVSDANLVTSSADACDVKWGAGVYAVTEDTTINGSVILDGDVTLLLKDGATLTVNGAVYHPDDPAKRFSLTLFGQENGTGKLKATGAVLSGEISRAIYVTNLIVNGGVLDASLPDTEELTPEIAIHLENMTVNGGTVYATSGDVLPEEKNESSSVFSIAIGCTGELTINGGKVYATSGEAYDNLQGNESSALNVFLLTVNGGELVASCNANNAKYRYDICARCTTITGGTVKSARDSKAVGVSVTRLNVSGGSIKLARIMDNCSLCEINVSGSVSLADLLAEGYAFYCDGAFVNTEGLTKLGGYDDESWTGAEIWILKSGETPESLQAKNAYAFVTYTMEYDGEEYGVQEKIYVEDLSVVFDALKDSRVENITLLKDISVTDEEIEEFVVPGDMDYFPVNSERLTLDLNGHSLIVEDSETFLGISNKMLIKDSSKAQNGKLEFGGLVILDMSDDGEMKADCTIESGNVSVKMTYVLGGQLTVSGGTLKNEYGIISQYAKIRLSGGEIAADMQTYVTILEVTGGKITQGSRSSNYGIRLMYGSVVNISGGEIDNALTIGETSNTIQLSGGEFREIYAENDAGNPLALRLLAPGYAYFNAEDDSLLQYGYTTYLKHVTVKPHSCEFEEETEGDGDTYSYCECGRVKLDAGGSEENAVAKIVYNSDFGDERTIWAESFFALMQFVCSSYNTEPARITLLDDVGLSNADLDECDDSFRVISKNVIDLNGHTLDLTYTDEENETTTCPTLWIGDGSELILTDSSADKSGTMKIGNITIERLGNMTVNGGTLLSAGKGYNAIYGRFAVADGTADFGTNETFVSRGSVTLAGGVLKCSKIYLGVPDYVSPQSLEEDESETESESPFDWSVKLIEAIDKGDNMLISGGELKGSVYLCSNHSLRVTGGKISDLSEDDKSFIWSGGGELTVTGGEIATLGVITDAYTKAGFTLLSGGTFENIFLDGGSEADVLGFLADGCAYYATETGSPVRPAVYVDEEEGEIDDIYTLSEVTVKSHSCTFDASGLCACGRKGTPNVTAVSYLDENGNEKQTANYKLLTGTEKKLTDGWYVVKGNVSFQDSVTVEGADVHLILTDGSTLTVNGKIAKDEKEAVLTVYGQKKNSGTLSVSGAVHVEKAENENDEDYTTYVGIYLDDFTVNGGTVNVLLNQTTLSCSDAIYGFRSVVINGGYVNAKGADITTASDYVCSYAVWAACEPKKGEYGHLKINGGTVRAVGGNVTLTDLEEYSYIQSSGIGARLDTVVSGGVVTAQGGAVTAEASCNITAYTEGISSDCKISGGVVNAIGGDMVLRYTGNDKDTGNRCIAQSNGIYSYGLELTGGALNVVLGSAKATGTGTSNRTSGITDGDELTVSGGTLTVTGEPKNETDYTVGISGEETAISGGTVNIMSEGLNDDIYTDRLALTGGTVKNGKTGALKLYCNYDLFYSGGEMKLGALDADYLESKSNISLTELLADGYRFYSDGMWIDRTGWVNTLPHATVIGYDPVDVSLAVGNTENKASFNVSELNSVLGDASSYKVLDYDDEKISATIDEETGVLTVSPTEEAQAGDEATVNVKISYPYYYMCLQVNVLLTSKTVPTVTLNGSTIEKVYDGNGIAPSQIASVATVTADDETVAGEWQWQSNVPVNVSDGFVTAYFVPTDEGTYAPVTVSVPVNITAKTVSGAPSYQKISESGKTLADAKLSANSAWPKGSLSWVDDKGAELSSDTVVAKNTAYRWKFTPASANYASAEGSVTLYSVSGGNTGSNHSSGSNNNTTVTKNPDGSTTTVTENKANGTITETTENTDGSTVTVETKKDGTVTTTEKDGQGNTVTTVEDANGGVTTTEKRKDGTTVTTVTDENGTTRSEIKTDEETEITIPTDDAENITKITVTDKDGNQTEITEFETNENGVTISVSGDCTVKIERGNAASNPAETSGFGDVSGHWAAEAIGYAVENGLMSGISDTEFAPDAELTRAMLVTILYRAAGSPEVNKSIPFADVTADSYYANAVIWAQQNDIVSGMNESEFAPDENITREQIATILYRFAKAMGYDVSVGEDTNILSYADAEEISEYAVEAMQYAVGSGLMKGKTETTLNPKDNATRGEIATILQRFIEGNK